MRIIYEDLVLASFGGLLIAIASSLHLILKGRITGFSGIFYSIVTIDQSSFFWKASLLAGVSLSSSVLYLIYGNTPIIFGASPAFDTLESISKIGYVGAAISGALVGFGTKMGNGCTSGHGVCGLPRLSIRSIVAVLTFMTVGVITATIKAQIIQEEPTYVFQSESFAPYLFIIFSLIVIFIGLKQQYQDTLVATLVGVIFGAGLVVSGMVKRTKIIAFLTLNQNWDPSLIFVMLVAVSVNLVTFRLFDKPFLATKFEIPTNKVIDWKLVLGAAIFGIGWGAGGLCPGPAIALSPQFTLQVGYIFLTFLAIGQIGANKVVQISEKKTKI